MYAPICRNDLLLSFLKIFSFFNILEIKPSFKELQNNNLVTNDFASKMQVYFCFLKIEAPYSLVKKTTRSFRIKINRMTTIQKNLDICLLTT